MDDLSKVLERMGFDLIDGATREQRLLQIWVRRSGNAAVLEFEHIKSAFENSAKTLTLVESKALEVSSDSTKTLGLKLGMTFLEDLLQKNGLGSLGINLNTSKTGNVKISFSSAFSVSVELGVLRQYFEHAEVLLTGNSALKDLNRDNYIVITGVLFAKEFKGEITSEATFDAGIEASLVSTLSADVKVIKETDSKLILTAPLEETFPIAAKYHKIKFKKGTFQDLILISDTRDIF